MILQENRVVDILSTGTNGLMYIIHLSVSPDEVCPGVAGVMDHHQLLAQAAVTATRGAADGVIVQEDHGEQDSQDVRWASDGDDFFELYGVV